MNTKCLLQNEIRRLNKELDEQKNADGKYHIGVCEFCKNREGSIWFTCKLDGKLVSPNTSCPQYEG